MGESLEQVAQSLHDRLFVANVHGDYGIEFALEREEHQARAIVKNRYLPLLRDGGVNFEFYTVGGDHRIFTQDDDLTRGTFRSIDHALQELELESDESVIVRRFADIDAARRAGKLAFLLTIEGAAPLQNDLSILRNFYRLGLRSVILTWFKSNPSADGVAEERNGGLSNFGQELVREMNRLGMLIDICQCAPQTVEDVFEVSTHPVISSHSNAAGLYDHPRNLTDSQLRKLANGGGVIGVTSFPAHVGRGKVSIEDFLDHIDYITNLIGDDHLAIGLNIVVHKASRAQNFYRNSDIEYSDLWLPGLEDVDKMGAITLGLLKRGYDEDRIAKILGGNISRVLSQVLPVQSNTIIEAAGV